MVDLDTVLCDLAAENQEVDDMVAPLTEAAWRQPTPAAGWTIAHQIAHLAWTDAKALIATNEPASFPAEVEQALGGGGQFVDDGAQAGAQQTPSALLGEWRTGRRNLAAALANVTHGQRLPWYGPSMSPASMASGRMMETWAHGQDIADALDLHRTPSARLRHIARFGVRTRDFAFTLHGRTPPTEEFRVQLQAPDGDDWVFGPVDASQRVAGSAVDFCLVVTQRRHVADTDLVTTGALAADWVQIAQAFAGPPGTGRVAGQFK